jgi:hypothetical protein
MHLFHVRNRDFEYLTYACGASAQASRGEAIDLKHDHVAAVATAALEQPSGGRVGADRGHDLQERVAQRKHRVTQSEVLNGGIAVGLAEAETLAKLTDDCLQVARGDDCLAQTGKRRSGSCHAGGR